MADGYSDGPPNDQASQFFKESFIFKGPIGVRLPATLGQIQNYLFKKGMHYAASSTHNLPNRAGYQNEQLTNIH